MWHIQNDQEVFSWYAHNVKRHRTSWTHSKYIYIYIESFYFDRIIVFLQFIYIYIIYIFFSFCDILFLHCFITNFHFYLFSWVRHGRAGINLSLILVQPHYFSLSFFFSLSYYFPVCYMVLVLDGSNEWYLRTCYAFIQENRFFRTKNHTIVTALDLIQCLKPN